MAPHRTPRLGLLELAGMGFSGGVAAGTAASYLLDGTDVAVSCTGALGAVLLPILWLGVAAPTLRSFGRLVRRRVPAPRAGRVTA